MILYDSAFGELYFSPQMAALMKVFLWGIALNFLSVVWKYNSETPGTARKWKNCVSCTSNRDRIFLAFMSVLKYFCFSLLLSPLWSTCAQGTLLGWEFGSWWLAELCSNKHLALLTSGILKMCSISVSFWWYSPKCVSRAEFMVLSWWEK